MVVDVLVAETHIEYFNLVMNSVSQKSIQLRKTELTLAMEILRTIIVLYSNSITGFTSTTFRHGKGQLAVKTLLRDRW